MRGNGDMYGAGFRASLGVFDSSGSSPEKRNEVCVSMTAGEYIQPTNGISNGRHAA